MADADEEIDRLYGLPADEFTAARNDLAKRLRKEGDKEAADAVAALKRPSAAAAAVNRLVRERRDDVEELMEAGDELRSAQEEVLGGGDRKAMRSAQERERKLVSDLAGSASEGASAAVREKVEETLRAAALGEEAREEVLAGRLERELEPDAAGAFGVFGGGGGGAGTAKRPAKKAASKKGAAPPKKKDAAEEKRKRRVAELEKRLAAEEKRADEARRRLEEAEGAAIDARREADQAASRAKSAEREAERRRDRHEEAQGKADAARDELEKARG